MCVCVCACAHLHALQLSTDPRKYIDSTQQTRSNTMKRFKCLQGEHVPRFNGLGSGPEERKLRRIIMEISGKKSAPAVPAQLDICARVSCNAMPRELISFVLPVFPRSCATIEKTRDLPDRCSRLFLELKSNDSRSNFLKLEEKTG